MDGRRFIYFMDVSTHSRPKAAGSRHLSWGKRQMCFNTQPPEGGWHCLDLVIV